MSAELLLSVCERRGGRYAALLVGGGRGQTVLAASESLALAGSAAASPEELRVEEPGGEVSASLRSAGDPVGMPLGAGAEARAVPVEAGVNSPRGQFTGPGVLWRLPAAGRLPALLRALWAAVDGRLLLALAGREQAGDEHGEEALAAVMVGGDGAAVPYRQPLLSTEYDADGAPLRTTLELWPEDGAGIADRGGGLRAGGGRASGEHGRLEAARIDWTLDGATGCGGYEILAG